MEKSVFYLVLLLFATVYGDHHEHHDHQQHVVKTEQDFIKYHDDCVSHEKINSEVALRYRNFEYADDETTHKYMKCIFERSGFLDSQGHFDDQAIHEQLAATLKEKAVHSHDDKTHHLVTNCIAKYKDTKVDCLDCRAYRVSKCIFKDAPIKWY